MTLYQRLMLQSNKAAVIALADVLSRVNLMVMWCLCLAESK